jgi:uncharacterized protein YndB with AHSA1/START domain
VKRATNAGAIRHAVTVELPREAAFARFVDDFRDWWPAEYTWSQDVLEQIGIEPREGGMCFERGRHGFRCDWGRVLAFEPPRRLGFRWQISPRREPVPDERRASEVELRFEAEGNCVTRVELEHRGFERHGEGDAYRDALASEQGWPYILGRYASRRPVSDRRRDDATAGC